MLNLATIFRLIIIIILLSAFSFNIFYHFTLYLLKMVFRMNTFLLSLSV